MAATSFSYTNRRLLLRAAGMAAVGGSVFRFCGHCSPMLQPLRRQRWVVGNLPLYHPSDRWGPDIVGEFHCHSRMLGQANAASSGQQCTAAVSITTEGSCLKLTLQSHRYVQYSQLVTFPAEGEAQTPCAVFPVFPVLLRESNERGKGAHDSRAPGRNQRLQAMPAGKHITCGEPDMDRAGDQDQNTHLQSIGLTATRFSGQTCTFNTSYRIKRNWGESRAWAEKQQWWGQHKLSARGGAGQSAHSLTTPVWRVVALKRRARHST